LNSTKRKKEAEASLTMISVISFSHAVTERWQQLSSTLRWSCRPLALLKQQKLL
jgi:hypothetical protein